MKDVLREVRITRLTPATGAVALLLRIGVERAQENEVLSFDRVKEWLSKQDASTKATLLFKESMN